MDKHTPGPWEIVPLREHNCDEVHRRCQYETDDGIEVCSYSNRFQIHHSVKSDSALVVADVAKAGEKTLANARLIASAPDLLKACKAAKNVIDGHGDIGVVEMEPFYSTVYCLLVGAIAKAEAAIR